MEKPYRRMMRALRGDRDSAAERDWSVYVVRCGDGSFYTGIAKDLEARVKKHNSGAGAAYTRSRRPVTLCCSQSGLTRSEALVLEARIKASPRAKKIALLNGFGEKSENPSPL